MGQNFTNELEQHNDLQKRKAYSESTLANINLKAEAAFRDAPTPIAIFAAGSLGRLEIGRESDLDLFIVSDKEDSTRVNRLEEIRVFSKLIEINRELKLPEFSGDGRYLKIHNLTELINSTGDAHDDSENFFTTRLLLLLESSIARRLFAAASLAGRRGSIRLAVAITGRMDSRWHWRAAGSQADA